MSLEAGVIVAGRKVTVNFYGPTGRRLRVGPGASADGVVMRTGLTCESATTAEVLAARARLALRQLGIPERADPQNLAPVEETAELPKVPRLRARMQRLP